MQIVTIKFIEELISIRRASFLEKKTELFNNLTADLKQLNIIVDDKLEGTEWRLNQI